ncbi:hypothetical protein ACFPN7_35295 [Amycolatopsis halotolerans]|uniref:hypothetical protein n=1 Tax=Amycolatopsis halotolerans TaxID=330083 RepID=UPI0036239049
MRRDTDASAACLGQRLANEQVKFHLHLLPADVFYAEPQAGLVPVEAYEPSVGEGVLDQRGFKQSSWVDAEIAVRCECGYG